VNYYITLCTVDRHCSSLRCDQIGSIYFNKRENREFSIDEFSVSYLITQMHVNIVMRESLINILKIFQEIQTLGG